MSRLNDGFSYRTEWLIRRYADDAAFQRGEAYDVSKIDGNLLLNAGITLLLNLLAGAGGTPFNNTNSRLGVGDSTAAEAAGQTDLQAGPNKLFRGMAATYPLVSAQSITFRAVFAGPDANYAWQEFAVDNGTTKLNRKLSNQGTKTAGQTWTLDLTITLS
jgi:hypothetical protein